MRKVNEIMASIKDVAKHAGVGVGTVSRVLNETGYVSEDTKRKVNEAMDKLSYTPNELARNLYRNRTGIIGVVIPDLDHPFFSAFTKYVEMALYAQGYKAMICNTVATSNREKEYLEMLDRNIVDGIITASHSLDDESYLKNNKPIVSLDRDFGDKIPRISSNHEKGGLLAAKELIRCKCKNVIQFTGSQRTKNRSFDRHMAFARELTMHGIQVTTVETAWNKFTYNYFHQIMTEFMNKYTDVDGIFTMDIPAICCLNIAIQKGISVPGDLKIIGYDGTYLTKMVKPTLTTVKQPIKKLAEQCVETVLQMVAGEEVVPKCKVLDVSLQVGGTTRVSNH